MDEQEQQNAVSNEQQEVNQVAPTPLSPSPSHAKLIIGIVAVFVLIVGGVVGVYFLLQPNATPEASEQIDTDEAKIGINSGIDKFYYAVIEKSRSADNVTIFKYDIDEASVSKAFGPYPSNANYLEYSWSPRVALSDNRKQVIFSDSALYSFRGGIKEFNIIAPHEDLVTGDTESPVLSPDGEKIVYAVGNQIKMFDVVKGEYTVLIEDVTPLYRGAKNPTSVFPAYWYRNNEADRLLIEVRSKNQNSIPIALTKFYVYDFAQNAYSPTEFYYKPGKKIQQCSGYGWQCEESPIVKSRSPNGRYELITVGDIGDESLSIIDFSVLTNTHWETEGAIIPLSVCSKFDNIVWSYDSNKLLCSGLDLTYDNVQFVESAITNLNKEGIFNVVYKYITIDAESGTIIDTIDESLKIIIPQEARNELLDQLKETEDVLAAQGIVKGTEEYNSYMSQAGWGVFVYLQSQVSEKAKNVIGWIGKDTYLASKTILDEIRYDPTSQEVILTNLKGNDKSLGIYTIDSQNRSAEQTLTDEVYIKYIGSVVP